MLAPKVKVALHVYAKDHPDIATLVVIQDRVAKAWVEDFANQGDPHRRWSRKLSTCSL